jgi:plastocyanin
VIAATLLSAAARICAAGELSVTVSTPDGRGVAGAVVVAEPLAPAAAPRTATKASVNQKDLMFVPEILVVRTGAVVEFPNNDSVRHQVYSFSGAKRFQLSLYAGSAHAPVVFDKPGLVTLGCNIHDGMIGYILVTDSPWFGRADKDGKITLPGLPAAEYNVRIWHPRIRDAAETLTRSVSVAANASSTLLFQLRKTLNPPLQSHGTASRWEDY